MLLHGNYWTSNGVILIGQGLIYESTDEEIEGIIAHEIGHIKNNHINKTVGVTVVAGLLANYLIKKNIYQNMYTTIKLGPIERTFGINASHITAIVLAGTSALLIGKRFEKEADQFAFEKGNRAQGLIRFLKRMKDKESIQAKHLNNLESLLESSKNETNYADSCIDYYFLKATHLTKNLHSWLYHNTIFGPHPSYDARIKAAQKYLK